MIAADDGAQLRVATMGHGPLVLFVHGFPESWYSWRHQLSAVAAAGCRVAAMDVRGYGGSAQTQAIEAYSLENLVDDVAAVVKALSPDGKSFW